MTIIFSSVDRHNYGDLLYPIIINKLLNDNYLEKNIYSFLEVDSPGKSGYKVNRISKYFMVEEIKNDSIIIGGGDSLRVDREALAEHCASIYNKSRKTSILKKIKEYFFDQKDFAKEFISKFMNYDAPGPFIIDKDRFSQINQVIYCSCGVPFEFSNEVKYSVASAFNNASFIYLRDEQSKQKLINIGVKKDIFVAPDIICTISDFFEIDTHKQKGFDILYAHGLQKGKDFLCFQANPSCQSNIDEIINQLTKIKLERNIDIVLLPIGYCHNDDIILKEINNRSNNQFIYADVYSIYDILSIITASSIFIGTSMHGNITAFSYGIPHLVAPINVDKIKGFLDVCHLSNNLLLDSWTEISEKIDYLDTLEKDYFSSRAIIAKEKIYNAMSSISKLISDNN